MLDGWIVVLAALVYLCVLFAVAHFGDTRGGAWVKGRFRSTLYALTLAVYCTSWTFFGSVGLASVTGYDFLAIYIGPILLIGLGSPLIRRIARLAKSQNITSVADFVGARYGKSQRVAAIVAVIAVIGTIPYIALQLKAISSSIKTILEAHDPGTMGAAGAAFGDLALLVALILAAFTTAFGTRHIDAREHHHGLMFAIGVESAIKLLAFLIAGFFISYVMFNGVGDILAQVAARPDIVPFLDRSSGIANLLTMAMLSMLIILLLPRQFYVTIVENTHEADIKRVAWMFPLYLVLINLFVIPIALAANLTFAPGTIDRDMAILHLPLAHGDGLITLIVFLGGLSAATAMVIVECVALGTMVSNDLVMPVILRRRAALSAAAQDMSRASGDLGGLVLAIRRIAIILIILAGYAYFRATSAAALASIGLMSFAAIAQIAPAFFGGLFWRRGNALGATAGLISGITMWTYTLALPNLADPASVGLDQLLRNGPFGLEFLKPTALFGSELSLITHGALWSLGVNVLAYIGFSLLRRATPIERLQATMFAAPERAPIARSLKLWRSSLTIGELKAAVARYLGAERTEQAFASFAGSDRDDGREADIHALRFAEHQLASAIGAASSRLVLSLLLRRRDVTKADALRLLDDASTAIQYNRDLIQHAFDHVRQGITVFDKDMRLMFWNHEFQTLFELPDALARTGVGLDEIVGHAARSGLFGPGQPERIAAVRLDAFVRHDAPVRMPMEKTGAVIELRSADLPDGGIVTTYTDITASVRAEEALERRVEERTQELQHLNTELEQAKAVAEAADQSKTRFLAAASHDILQPLNAARLFVSSLLDRDRGTGDPQLANHIGASLEAIEDILTTLLDISRLDAGALKPEISAFRLSDILSALQTELEPLAREKNLDLVHVPTTLVVRSDKRLLRRLIQNLLSNAIKYTPEGRVLIGCRRAGKSVRIEIWDTGIGIPAAKRKTIFEEFQRLDQGAKVARGLGLGLSIVERIGRLLGHQVRVKSWQDKGSMFSVEVPVAPASTARRVPERTASAAPLGSFNGLRVLAIDNDPAILDGMNTLLSGWGCAVQVASNGEEAEKCASDPDHRPAVIIADYHLDEGDGLAVIGALRSLLGSDIPAILLTADRSLAVRDAAVGAGITVLHKPLKPAALRALLTQWR